MANTEAAETNPLRQKFTKPNLNILLKLIHILEYKYIEKIEKKESAK